MASCGRGCGRARGARAYGSEGVAGHGTSIVVRRSPLSPTRGILRLGPLAIPCALGRSGTTARKREGDGATPLGCHRVLSGAARRDRWRMVPPSPLPLPAIHASDGWCDAPADPAYNRPVRLPHRSSAERMRRDDRLYDAVVVLDFNVIERVRGRGSAIFFHVSNPGMPPTEGCIALSPRAMRTVLPHLRRGRRLVVI